MMLIFMGLLIFNGNVTFQTKHILTVPESAGLLEQPRYVVRGEKGRFYTIDVQAKCLFVWDANGRFEKKVGQRGGGPGEFVFRWTGYSFIGWDGRYITVLDSGESKIHYFEDGEFIKSLDYHFPGRITGYSALEGGRHLALHENYRNKSQVVLYDADWNELKVIFEFKDRRWQRTNQGWVHRAFLSVPTFHGEPNAPFFVFGFPDRPEFLLYDLDGKKKRTVSFRIARKDVTPKDKETFRKAPWLQAQGGKLVFPEQKPYYTDVLPISGGRFVVYNQSSWSAIVEGLVLDGNGETQGSFQDDFGVNGGIDSLEGMLVIVDLNDPPQIRLSEIVVNKTGLSANQ